jgi:hypothetical protein
MEAHCVCCEVGAEFLSIGMTFVLGSVNDRGCGPVTVSCTCLSLATPGTVFVWSRMESFS